MDRELAAALADDLEQLIRLHDRELDPATVDALKSSDFPAGLALLPDAADSARRRADLAAAIAGLDAAGPGLDDLAADFAAIYLTHALGVSPYESVWLSDDQLACGPPMFELRACYAAAGWQAGDWRQRFDDHLVLQLQYVRQRLGMAAVDVAELAIFIDEHLGYWLPEFAERVAARCRTPFYATLAGLTADWLRIFRQLLTELGAPAVPERAEITARIDRKLARDKADVAPLRFMPGAQGPGW